MVLHVRMPRKANGHGLSTEVERNEPERQIAISSQGKSTMVLECSTTYEQLSGGEIDSGCIE